MQIFAAPQNLHIRDTAIVRFNSVSKVSPIPHCKQIFGQSEEKETDNGLGWLCRALILPGNNSLGVQETALRLRYDERFVAHCEMETQELHASR